MILQAIISQNNRNAITSDVYASKLIDTIGISSELKALDPFFTYEIMYNEFDNHWYVATLTTGGVPHNRASLVYRINSDLEIVDSYEIPLDISITSAYDNHPAPVIFIDNNGALWLCRETSMNSTGYSNGHNTAWLIYKTDTPDDLSTLSLFKTITGFFAYPNIQVYGSEIYVTGRGRISNINLNTFSIQISSDSGLTFTEQSVYATSDNNLRAYQNAIFNYDDNDLIFCANIRNDIFGSFVSIHILRSTNGVTWRNMENTFSKDVSSGIITKSELDTNFLVWQYSSPLDVINFEGGVLKDGKLRLLVSRSEKTDTIVLGNTSQIYKELRLYTYDDDIGWEYKDLSYMLPENYEHVWALQRVIQLCWDSANDYVYVVDKTGIKDQLKVYKSNNIFDEYLESTLDEFDGDIYFGSHSANAVNNENRLLVLLDVQGSFVDFDSSSNLILYTPE